MAVPAPSELVLRELATNAQGCAGERSGAMDDQPEPRSSVVMVPWVIDADGTWYRAQQAPKGGSLFCPVCLQPVVLKRGTQRVWHAAHAPGVRCLAPSSETYLHQLAKRMIARHIAEWRAGLRAPPIIRYRCAMCDRHGWQPLDPQIDRALIEYRLPDGSIADVALCAGDEPRLVVEVRVTHPVPAEKAARLAVPWIEVDGQVFSDGMPHYWDVLAGTVVSQSCDHCRSEIRDFYATARRIAQQWNLTLPKGPPYRYGITHCWKCQHTILVVAWPRQAFYPTVLPAKDPITRMLRYRYSHTAQCHYWANVCPHCHAMQGNWFLYDEPDGPFFPVMDDLVDPSMSDDSQERWQRDMRLIAHWWAKHLRSLQ